MHDYSYTPHPNIVCGHVAPPSVHQDNRSFKRGARRTPQHKVVHAIQSGRLGLHEPQGAPPQFALIAKQLSMWLNDVDGDCVTAEEAAAIAGYTSYCGTEYFVTDQTVLAFATKYNVLNGADLLPVIQDMEKDGFHQGSDVIEDGGVATVDYTIAAAIQSAISQAATGQGGQVKIAIDANALPSGAGNGNGWYSFGGSPGQFRNTDHCVGIAAFGPPAWLAQQLGVPTPPSAPAMCYLVYTWKSYGFVDLPWIVSTTVEAYVRSGILINGKPVLPNGPTPPVPPIPPTPGPAPICVMNWPTLRKGQRFNGVASSAVPGGRYGLVPAVGEEGVQAG